MAELPDFDPEGNLPPGIYSMDWALLEARFATTHHRVTLFRRLQEIYSLAAGTRFLSRFIVFGSFVTAKPEPRDIDIVLVMQTGFEITQTTPESRLLFDHEQADQLLGASIFWIRTDLLILESVEAFIAYWQTRRDGGLRGIIEVVP